MDSPSTVVAAQPDTEAASKAWHQEHNAIVDGVTGQVPAAQTSIAQKLATAAKDDMGSNGDLPTAKTIPLEKDFDERIEHSGLAPVEQLALEAMGRELFLGNAAGLKLTMDTVQSLDAKGSNQTSQKLFEEFRADVLELAKDSRGDLTGHIHVADNGRTPEIDDSDVVIARANAHVPAADGLIVVAADGNVNADIGGGGTVVIGGNDTKLTGDDGGSRLPSGTNVYRQGLEIKSGR